METNNGHEPKVNPSVEELLDFESGHQNGHHDSDVEEDPSEGDCLAGDLEDGNSRGSFLSLFSLVDENVEERWPYEDQGNSTKRPSEGEDDLQVGNGDSDEIAKNGPNEGLSTLLAAGLGCLKNVLSMDTRGAKERMGNENRATIA